MTRLLENRAQVLFSEGRFDEAIEASEAGVESARRLLNPEDSESLVGLLDAMLIDADIKRHLGLLEAAETSYREVVRRAGGNERFRRAHGFARSGLGDICEEHGKATDAMRYYESAVKLLDGVGGTAAEESARLRNNLAMLFKDDGDHQAAEEHLIAGIQALEGSVGRYNQTTATLYSNLSALYMKVGHAEVAHNMALIARDIRRQILPANHQDNVQSLSNLGSILYSMDDLEGALSAYQQAVEIMESNWEIEPVDYEVVISNYIDLLNVSGREAEVATATKLGHDRYQALLRARSQATLTGS